MKSNSVTDSNTPLFYCHNGLSKSVIATAAVAAACFAAVGVCLYLQHITVAWSFLGVGMGLTIAETLLISKLTCKRNTNSNTASISSFQKKIYPNQRTSEQSAADANNIQKFVPANSAYTEFREATAAAAKEEKGVPIDSKATQMLIDDNKTASSKASSRSAEDMKIASKDAKPAKNPKAKLEQLQKNFWTEFYKNKHSRTVNLKLMFHMLMSQKEQDEISINEIVQMIIEQYNDTLSCSLNSEQIENLKSSFLLQIESFSIQKASSLKKISPDKTQPDYSHELLELSDGKILVTLFTRGTGSCGFDALLGKLKNGRYQVENIKEVRAEFCSWIRSRKDHLPDAIRIVLDDYFLLWDRAAISALKTRKNNRLHGELFSQFQKETNENCRDQIRKKFRDAILEDYLKNLKKEGTYLLQEELIAAAECFGKTLILYQPDWRNGYAAGETFNPGCAETIVVWFNGRNHYERAVILD